MSLTFIVFLLGMVYGFVNTGKEDRLGLIRKSLIIGFVFGLLVALAFFIFTIPAALVLPVLPLLGGIAGVLVGMFAALYFGVVFAVGTIVGDILESLIKR
ncbi:hypothetical protein [Geoglobus sp.]